MDLTKFVLGLDVWLGNEPIDEQKFKANGIRYMFVRMNTSAGQLQYDPNFLKQWKEGVAAGFKMAAYVVVSPTNYAIGGGLRNFTSKEVGEWILAWLPIDCEVVGVDVEIDARTIYPDPTVTPRYYSEFLHGIYDILISAGKKKLQYSGGWFYKLGAVVPWVSTVPQWWARYPFNPISYQKDSNGNVIYPVSSWEEIKAKIANQNWDPFGGYVTEVQVGHPIIWQICSAFVVPGCAPNQPVDINVMSIEDYEMLWPPVIPVESVESRVTKLETDLAKVSKDISTIINMVTANAGAIAATSEIVNALVTSFNKIVDWFKNHFPEIFN